MEKHDKKCQNIPFIEDNIDYKTPSDDRPFHLTIDNLNIYVSEEFGRQYLKDYWNAKKQKELERRCIVPSDRYGNKRCMENCSECSIYGTRNQGGTVSLDFLHDEYGYEIASSEETPSEWADKQLLKERIRDAIDSITDNKVRDVIELIYQDFNIAEISVELKIDRKTATKRKDTGF